MTKPNFTSINVIMDASGSMSHLRAETLAGFNKFLAEQKAVPGEATLTLCTFNTSCEFVYDCVPLQEISELSENSYNTVGGTALLDAVGQTTNKVGAKLASMNEEDRPSKVIVLIITDGFENCSREFSKSAIKEMISHQTDKYSWDFIFMGANMDAVAEGGEIGVTKGNSMTYSADSAGTFGLYNNVSESMTKYRSAAGHTPFFGK